MFFTIEHIQAGKSHVWQSFYFKLNILFEYCRIFSIIFFVWKNIVLWISKVVYLIPDW